MMQAILAQCNAATFGRGGEEEDEEEEAAAGGATVESALH